MWFCGSLVLVVQVLVFQLVLMVLVFHLFHLVLLVHQVIQVLQGNFVHVVH